MLRKERLEVAKKTIEDTNYGGRKMPIDKYLKQQEKQQNSEKAKAFIKDRDDLKDKVKVQKDKL